MDRCIDPETAVGVLSDESRLCSALIGTSPEDDQCILQGRNLVRRFERLGGGSVCLEAIPVADMEMIVAAAALVEMAEVS